MRTTNQKVGKRFGRALPDSVKAESKARQQARKPPKSSKTNAQRKAEWVAKNKPKAAEQLRRSSRKRLGGDPDSTTRPMPMFCEACGAPPSTWRSGSQRLAWDHDHATGKFRGWLCTQCNSALGLLQDSPDRIAALLSYLREYSND